MLALPAGASAWGFVDDFADAADGFPSYTGREWAEVGYGNLQSATKETGEPDHAGFPGGHSVWSSWKIGPDKEVQVSACGANGADLLIAVYTGSALDELTEVASESEETANGCVVANFKSQAVTTTYQIAVDAKSSPGTTEISARMKTFSPNDDFADAIVLPEFPTTMYVDSELATTEPGEPEHWEDGWGRSVWFRWTPTESGLASIGSCGYWENGRFAVYTGAALTELTQVATGKGGGSNCGHWGEARFQAEKGTTYSIAVEGNGERGSDLGVEFRWVQKAFLSVSKSGSETGMVVSEPAGIECGASCQAVFYRPANIFKETPVALTAVPDPGSVFVGWSGDKCSDADPVCEFTMYITDVAVEAEFEDVTPEFEGSRSPSGTPLPTSTTTPAGSLPPALTTDASQHPKRPQPKCAKRKKQGKKAAKAAKRRACKR